MNQNINNIYNQLRSDIIRKSKEELSRICSELGVDRLWSFSRFNCYRTSQYEYFLKYILKKQEDLTNCIYGCMGGWVHDILEKLYGNEIKYEDMFELFDDDWLTAETIGLKFDRTNEEKNQSISKKYKQNLTHFVLNHKQIPYNLVTERFVKVKVGDYYFQGYIDACYKDDNDIIHILDWKTSSIYKGDKAVKESAQLLLYAQAMNQLGIPFDKIKCSWNFLKYCNVTQFKANLKDTTIRTIERAKLGESLSANLKMVMKKLGYSETDIKNYNKLVSETNGISCLPEDVQALYTIEDCYVDIDINDDAINTLNTEIISTLDEICNKEKEYAETKDENLWWDSAEHVKEESYYFANLCGYSGALHKPYGKYVEQYNLDNENKDNIFYNKGETKIKETLDDDDMSWLNDIL